MTQIDKQYIDLATRILKDGIFADTRNGPVKKLFGQTLRFNIGEEFPILTSKFVPFKHGVLEMLWMYQEQSSDARWLEERGIKLWKEWTADENGNYELGNKKLSLGIDLAHTIGTAYGWIVKKYEFIDKLLFTLKNNPNDRYMVYSLWQDEHLATSTHPPCIWALQFCVTGKKLNLTVTVRSNDVFLGMPIDIASHAALLSMIAHVSGYQAGEILWVINDAHIYEKHFDSIQQQIDKYNEVGCPPAPKLWINPKVKDFFKFDNTRELSDIRLENYEYNMRITAPVSTGGENGLEQFQNAKSIRTSRKVPKPKN